MPPLPEEMLVPMVGVMAGLLVFAALLQLGVWIVRRLKLPNDLPEGPHFEPPPPAIRDALDRGEAVRIAAKQAELRQRYAEARAAAQAAQRCAELAAQDYVQVEGAPDPATAKSELSRLAAIALSSAEACDRAVRSVDSAATVADCAALAAGAMTAAKEAEGLVARFPSGQDRRLRLLAVILVVVAVWSILMFTLGPQR